MVTSYFEAETRRLADRSLADVETRSDWEKKRSLQRSRLLEMLGLDPLPEKTPLKPAVTGTVDHEEFIVENVHFQSRPGLYVTGNLYRPRKTDGKRLPAVLYVCGHGRVKKNGISYGNKVHYQHHGAWFARNGYVCLTIDTLQLGEIEGIHHGTYSHGRFWWNSRGYTPAGVEAWNCVRALDYLQSRPEVDGQRLGVTGRSGGGAYSWWIAAIDERIQVAVPVAGITSLHNHVVDGTVEGHCDCMFMVNTYGWDFAQVAALVAPRPLLISNTDKDRIFPLDGVVDVYTKTRKIYELYGARDRFGLQITEGPHKDTQELRVHAFHWFNRFLKGEDPLIETTAVKFFEPEQLKVFDQLPEDEVNTTIDETFVAAAYAAGSEGRDVKLKTGNCALAELRNRMGQKCFRGWPFLSRVRFLEKLELQPRLDLQYDGVQLQSFDFLSQEHVPLTLFILKSADLKSSEVELSVLNVLDEDGWNEFLALVRNGFDSAFKMETDIPPDAEAWDAAAGMLKSNRRVLAFLCPRGIGPTAWDQSVRKQTQHRRRFALLGQTLDGMRLWDILRGLNAVRQTTGKFAAGSRIWLQAKGRMTGLAVYAGVFDWSVSRLDLYDLPLSHRDGPEFLNVLRLTDIPQSITQLGYRTRVVIYDQNPQKWTCLDQIAASQAPLAGGGIRIRPLPK